MSDEIDLALGILDHQIVDVDGRRCGNVDDLELSGIRDGSPAVEAILVGRRRQVRVPWTEVKSVDSAVRLRRKASELRLGRGDDRARKFIEWIPGSHEAG
jgi:sporulation protein YlmC with PRC-barrel domain